MIDQANDLAANWAPLMWRATWQGGLFVLAVWAICKAFPRIPAASRHWLWWLASAQLLVRLAMATPIALPLLPAQRTVETPTMTIQDVTTVPDVIQVQQSSTTVGSVKNLGPQQPEQSRPSVALLAMSAWYLGLVVCFGNLMKRLIRSRSYLHGKSLFDDNGLADLVEDLSGKIGVRPPPVRESRKAPCALLVGWLKPAIVLPIHSVETLTEVELKMAIAHELIHLKRRDLWLSLVPDASQVLFFFHPLAWLAAGETAAAREEACDHEALKLSGGSPAAYARLLVNSAQASSTAAVMGAAIGYRLIQRRINMLKSSTPGYGPITRRALTGVIALATVCALPWTVTAQSVATPVKVHNASVRKSVKKHAKAVAKHVAKKNAAVKASSMKVAKAVNVPAVGNAATMIAVKAVNVPRIAFTSSAGTTAVLSHGAQPRFGSTTAAPASVRVPTTSTARTAVAPTVTSGSSPATVLSGSARTTGNTTPSVETVQTAAAPTGSGISYDNGLTSVEFTKVDLHEAMKAFCKQARIDYTMRSDVRDDVVTISVHNAAPLAILQAILKTVKQSLTYRVEDGIVQIYPKSGD